MAEPTLDGNITTENTTTTTSTETEVVNNLLDDGSNGEAPVTDENGNEVTDNNGEDSSFTDNFFLDETFETPYSIEQGYETYRNNLLNGLAMKEIRCILGHPPQFLPTTDPRITGYGRENTTTGESAIPGLGRMYSEKILSYMPILFLTPGVPVFMSGFKKEKKKSVLEAMLKNDAADYENIMQGSSGKYYSLKFAYVEYFRYVNTILRSQAIMLEIDDKSIFGDEESNPFHRLGVYDWTWYGLGDDMGLKEEEYSSIAEKFTDVVKKGYNNFLGPNAGAIAFYADCGSDVSDSFSNDTTQSSVSGMINGLSDKARELNFLLGTAGSQLGFKVDKWFGQEGLDQNIENVNDMITNMIGGTNVFSSLLNKAKTIASGGRMIFPEIWSDSSFSRSYSCKLKLVSPSGDKFSIFMNILVPIAHLLCMCLPRQAEGQTYYSPFLVRAYYKSFFNIDMGIITSLDISKGGEGDWTVDGLPTVAEVSFSIKDLYSGMSMTESKSGLLKPSKLFSNVEELDYIATSCGININDQEVTRVIRMYKMLNLADKTDIVTNRLAGGVAQFFNQKITNLLSFY